MNSDSFLHVQRYLSECHILGTCEKMKYFNVKLLRVACGRAHTSVHTHTHTHTLQCQTLHLSCDSSSAVRNKIFKPSMNCGSLKRRQSNITAGRALGLHTTYLIPGTTHGQEWSLGSKPELAVGSTGHGLPQNAHKKLFCGKEYLFNLHNTQLDIKRHLKIQSGFSLLLELNFHS